MGATQGGYQPTVQKSKKEKVVETINQHRVWDTRNSEEGVMKEGHKAAGDWNNRERSDTNIQTTGRIRRGTAPGKGAACSPQGLPEMLDTVRWGQKLLRHYNDTNTESEKEITRKFKNMDMKYKKENRRMEMRKMVRYMKKKTERRRGETEWNTGIGTRKIKVATMNPDNLVGGGIIDEITDKMEKHNIDTTAIQETHDKRENDRKYRGHGIIKSASKE